jgi:hypothetical protein
MRLFKTSLISIFTFMGLFAGALDFAMAQCTLPYQLTNGQVADATQVMADYNAILGCLSSGNLTVPPVSSLSITGPGGGTATITNPAATANYNFNLPSGPGTPGQFLTSEGGTNPLTWTSAPSANPPPLTDGIPVGRPAASSFTWLNQGGASYAEYTNGPITLTVPAQSGDQVRGIGQAPPGTTPYTLTAKIDTMLWGKNFYVAGIYVLDSGGKLLTIQYQTATISGATPHNIGVNRWNSATSFNSSPKGQQVSESRVWWLRVKNDGTNWTFSVSPNGADWISFYSEGVTAFLGPTIASLGVFGDNNDTGGIGLSSFVSIWSYELASGSGTNSSWQSH